MKLRSQVLSDDTIRDILGEAIKHGDVPDHITLVKLDEVEAKGYEYAYEVGLGTDTFTEGRTRTYDNAAWRATRDEWGWLLARLFDEDPEARIGSYSGVDDFNRKTHHAFTSFAAN